MRWKFTHAADAAARIQPLYLVPEELPAWAAPGRAGVLSVEVEESAPESVALPHACVVTDGLRSVVFTRDAKEGHRFSQREVTLGASDGEWGEVKGLEPGAAVVLDGAYELKLAAPASAGGGQKKAAGHFHADGQFHEGEH
jgi:multidrug efflux pump subunit AcrA (membrane-fusion protein)